MLPREKVELLRRAFIEKAMAPRMAAKKAGVSTATANRYYEKWGEEIKKAREQQLTTQLKQSLLKIRSRAKK